MLVGRGGAGGEDGGASAVAAFQFAVQVADGIVDGAGHGQALGGGLEVGDVADGGRRSREQVRVVVMPRLVSGDVQDGLWMGQLGARLHAASVQWGVLGRRAAQQRSRR